MLHCYNVTEMLHKLLSRKLTAHRRSANKTTSFHGLLFLIYRHKWKNVFQIGKDF